MHKEIRLTANFFTMAGLVHLAKVFRVIKRATAGQFYSKSLWPGALVAAAFFCIACGNKKADVDPFDAWTRPSDGMVMVYVPAGEFEMGCKDNDKQPLHLVVLDQFWIDQTEVTNAQYNKCVDAGECEKFYPIFCCGFSDQDYPVIGVTWDNAKAYCEWVGGRLPTEAEWEYTARGSEGKIYPWGDTFDGEKLNYCDVNCTYAWKDIDYDDGYVKTAPVGSYPEGVSWCGALDMAGNVSEWVADWYGDYPLDKEVNPIGPISGIHRVFRGGAWLNPSVTHCNDRSWINPTRLSNFIGFRCARDFETP